MRMPPFWRRFSLVAHVSGSVGWLGAVACFFALSLVAVNSRDIDTVRSAYLAMNLVGLYVVVPLSLAALVTGVVEALATPWGLFRHYWVLTKFGLTVVATGLLLLHQFIAVSVAASEVGSTTNIVPAAVGPIGRQLVGDAGAAVFLLLVTTVLSIYKPWGKTPYGTSVAARSVSGSATIDTELPLRAKLGLAALAVLLAGIVIAHLFGRGLRLH
jgi:hypothetical protein